MLEPVGLVVDVFDIEPERVGEVELEQPVVADHLDRDLLARPREPDAAVGQVLDEPERREFLDHLAGRGRRDLLLPRESGHRYPLAVGLEVVELLQVVLDRIREHGLRHRSSVRPSRGAVSLRRLLLIRLGHSPDPDDAFMFWGLASGEVDPRRFEFEHVLRDIQTLNEWALEGKLEVTAISLAAYPLVQERYVLLPHGASMGSGYGPIGVSQQELSTADLRDVEIAVPGELTTAFLVLRLCLGSFRYREVPFDQILDEVREGRADAGLLIHEGQLTYESAGLKKVVDLGEWWLLETGLPLPLGGNVARRDVGVGTLFELSEVLRDSI